MIINKTERHALDATDTKILRELQKNGRLTNTELADRVGLSATPCWKRVKRLEEQGVIAKYVAILDPMAIGLPDSFFVRVKLDSNNVDVIEEFADYVSRLPEVQEAYLMTGDADYLVRVRVANTQTFDDFLLKKLLRAPHVAETRSSIALRCTKYSTALPL